jgi:hypothetical protein
MQSWFIENPISKDLVKSITIRMSPRAEKEFIIVMKAPSNRIKSNMASFLHLKSASHTRRMSSQNEGFEVEKRLKKRGSDLSDIDIELHKHEVKEPKCIKVMLLGRLENPEIKCLRELYH